MINLFIPSITHNLQVNKLLYKFNDQMEIHLFIIFISGHTCCFIKQKIIALSIVFFLCNRKGLQNVIYLYYYVKKKTE